MADLPRVVVPLPERLEKAKGAVMTLEAQVREQDRQLEIMRLLLAGRRIFNDDKALLDEMEKTLGAPDAT